MEITLKKLIDRREDLRKERIALDEEYRRKRQVIDVELKSLNTALAVIDPTGYCECPPWFDENAIAEQKPFKGMALSDACLKAVEAYEWGADKNQIEYLLTVGGYVFDADDPTNSVEVTLRRLAGDGRCAAQKRGGRYGSLYMPLSTKELNHAIAEKDSRTTST